MIFKILRLLLFDQGSSPKGEAEEGVAWLGKITGQWRETKVRRFKTCPLILLLPPGMGGAWESKLAKRAITSTTNGYLLTMKNYPPYLLNVWSYAEQQTINVCRMWSRRIKWNICLSKLKTNDLVIVIDSNQPITDGESMKLISYHVKRKVHWLDQ